MSVSPVRVSDEQMLRLLSYIWWVFRDDDLRFFLFVFVVLLQGAW